tara:strand:+ start:1166 stop:1654 length:489 start_codon:yes stop_codon:yes gene_type:complete
LNFEIIPYSKKFSDSINRLIDSCFGVGYSLSVNFNQEGKLAWCALNEVNELIGFTLLKVEDTRGVFELIVVDKSYRGLGLGTALFEQRIKHARYMSLDNIVLYHWFRPSSQEPFCALKFGFYASQIKMNHWTDQSLAFGYTCLECKRQPCICICIVYEMQLG